MTDDGGGDDDHDDGDSDDALQDICSTIQSNQTFFIVLHNAHIVQHSMCELYNEQCTTATKLPSSQL